MFEVKIAEVAAQRAMPEDIELIKKSLSNAKKKKN